MSYNSQLTRKCILSCARQEFMEHGYQKANMRRIAQGAKVTTGAMYNHFSNKMVLFDALVQAPAEDMLAQFRELHDRVTEGVTFQPTSALDEMAQRGTDWMLDFIFEHIDAFRLIFCRSEGTRWSSYLEELIAIEEQSYRFYFDKLCINSEPIDDFFLHVSAAIGFQYLVEIVSHNLPYERAVSIMNSVKRCSTAGWYELLGI